MLKVETYFRSKKRKIKWDQSTTKVFNNKEVQKVDFVLAEVKRKYWIGSKNRVLSSLPKTLESSNSNNLKTTFKLFLLKNSNQFQLRVVKQK